MRTTSTFFLPSSFTIWRKGGRICAWVESESLPGHFYFVSAQGNWAECNCPAWKKWGSCKHSQWVLSVAPTIGEAVREVMEVVI